MQCSAFLLPFESRYYILGSSQGGIATPRWDISLTQRERQILFRCRRDWLILSSKIHSLIPMFSGSLGLRNIWTGIVVGSQKDTVIRMNSILLTHDYAGWKLTMYYIDWASHYLWKFMVTFSVSKISLTTGGIWVMILVFSKPPVKLRLRALFCDQHDVRTST